MNTHARLGATFAAIAAAVALSACGVSDDLRDPPDTEDAEVEFGRLFVELGTGARRFELLTAGDEPTLAVIAGIQGGYHVWGGFLVSGVDPVDLAIEFKISQDGAVIGGANYGDDLHERVELEWGEAYGYGGVAVVFDSGLDLDAVSEQPVELSLTLRDRLGTTLSDSAQVRVHCCEL